MLPHPASRFREAGAGAVMCRALRQAEWQAQSGIWSAAPTQTVQEIALSATNINRSGYPAPDCSNPFDMRPIRERQLLGVGNVRFTQRALADLSLSPPTPRLATALVSKVPNKMTRTTPSSRGLWCVRNERQKDRLVLHGFSAVPHGELDVNTFLRNSYSE